MYTLRCSYLGKAQVTRGIPEEGLDQAHLLERCSKQIIARRPGEPEAPEVPSPREWEHWRFVEAGLGPWRWLEPEEAYLQCNEMLNELSVPEWDYQAALLEQVKAPNGSVDWRATFDPTGANHDLLAGLDSALWELGFDQNETGLDLPRFVTGLNAGGEDERAAGGQQLLFEGEEETTRILWDPGRLAEGVLVHRLHEGSRDTLTYFDSMAEALDRLAAAEECSREDLIARQPDEYQLYIRMALDETWVEDWDSADEV